MEYDFYYGRVSTSDQNPDRQRKQAEELGIPPERVYIDTASGRTFTRDKYQHLLGIVRPGDTIHIASLDRLGRTYRDTVAEYRRITQELGVRLVVEDMPILSTAADDPTRQLINDIVVQLLSYVADAEYSAIHARQLAGVEAAKLRGAYAGRQVIKVDVNLFTRLYAEVKAGDRTARSAASKLGVSENTFLRMRREYDTRTGRFAE